MRLNSNIPVFILFCILVGTSCVEPFMPDTTNYEDMLFIESLLTDDRDIPSKVVISRTVPLVDNEENEEKIMKKSLSTTAETGAIVLIHCDDGNIYPLDEVGGGQYIDADSSLQAEYGKQYRITIQTLDGNIFQSEFEELRASPPLDSITYSIKQQKLTDDGMVAHGYQFYVNTNDPQPGPKYYRWVLDATYIYNAPLTSTHIWIGGRRVEFENVDFLYCWKSFAVNGIYTATTEGLTENIIRNYPLHFVSQYGDQLSMKYSIHAVQYAITPSAYAFWRDLDKLVNQTGGLYETQPFQIEGNIKCTSDPSLNVAGIFELASVSEARYYASRPSEFPVIRAQCNEDTVGTDELPWGDLIEGSWLIEDEDTGVWTTSNAYCFDCSVKGGTLEKPPFWDY